MSEIRNNPESEGSSSSDAPVEQSTSEEVESANDSELSAPDEGQQEKSEDTDEDDGGDDAEGSGGFDGEDGDSSGEGNQEKEPLIEEQQELRDAPLDNDESFDDDDGGNDADENNTDGEENNTEGEENNTEGEGDASDGVEPKVDNDESFDDETEEPDGKTEEPDGKTEEPDGKTEEPDGKTEEPDGKTEEPDGKTEEPDGKTEEPDGKTEEPDGKTEEPDGKTEEPDGKTEEPDGKTEEPDGKTEEPDGKTEEPDGKIEDPEGTEKNPENEENKVGDPSVDENPDLRNLPLDNDDALTENEADGQEGSGPENDNFDDTREQQEAYQLGEDAGDMADDPTVMQQRTDTAEPPATQLEGGNGGNHNSPEKATDRKTQENLEGNSKPDPMTTEAGKGGSTGGDASNRGTSKPDTRRRDSHEGDPTANTKGREDMRNRPLDFIEVDKEMTKSPERVKPLTVDDVRNKSEKIPDAKLSQGDKDSFKDGKYETVQLKEPMTVYRYFGAHTPDEMSSLGLKNDQWGSDAGGRFLATNPDMTPDEAKQRLALKTDWGNNEAYLSTIELPAGTKICVGTVGEQKDLDGSILPGGETQIILLPENGNKEAWTTDNTKNWIKKCEPIGDAEPKVERSVENDTDRPLGDTAQNNQPLEAPARSEKPAEGSSEAMPKSDAPVENGTENDRPLEAPAGADRSTEGNTDTPAEGGEKSTEDKTLNQFGNKEAPEYDEGKTDLQNAQDDLDFANSQLEEYNRAVEAGEIEPNENTEQQLQDSIEYAQGHLDEIKNGQAYSYDSPGEYWASPEGREIAGDLYGTGLDMTMKGVEKVVGAEIPFGDNTVSDTSKNFGRTYGENYGYKDIGKAADLSQDLMENARNTYATEGDRYMQDNFMRDENGSPINAEQGRDRAFGHQEPTMHDNLHDPELFRKNAPGAYTYENGDGGKKAYGTLEVSSDGVRDAQAQRNAGGEDRKADDDGGHLIGTRFNGAPDSRNLDAQNSNLNRGSYNHREKTWQDAVNNGDKVYVNVETPRSNGSERPDAYMGYSITEHPDGSREWDAFSYQNASKAEQEAWNKELEDFDSQLPEDYDNPMKEVYDREGYNGDTEVKTEAAPKSETVTEGKPEAAPKSVETNEKSNGKLTESVGTSDMKKGDTSESIDSTDPKEIAEKLKNSQQEAYNEKLKKEDMRKTELNESLPKIDAELKGYIKDNGMDKYISKKKLDAPITKNTEALREDEMQKKYEKHGGEWRPYIKGFNDGKVSSVSVKMSDGDFKETVIHENYHQLSANDTSIGSLTLKSRRGVCINGKNDGLNEAMTQNYTLNTLKTTDPSYVSTDCAYNDAAKYVGELYNYGNNKELFDKAYFQNKPELLQQHIDKYCGEGTFSEMSKCFDTAATDPFATAAERQEALNKISDIVNLYKFNREME